MSCREGHTHVRACGDSGYGVGYCACGCSYEDYCTVERGSKWRNHRNQRVYEVVYGSVQDATNGRDGRTNGRVPSGV